MNVLHTSDWHLGVTLHRHSLHDEQACFLDWLHDVLQREKIDVLIVAGDIFHTAQPSNETRKLLYRFLSRVGTLPSLQRTVLIGGNHDSPATLHAPDDFYESLNVTVVGDARDATGDPDRLLVPVADDNGTVPLVIAAVPYVHAWFLGGARRDDQAEENERTTIRDNLAAIYDSCLDRARAQWPDARYIATGHLTCGTVNTDDYETPIHLIGGERGFDPDIFDPAWSYVALGHIHRAMPVDSDKRIWYAGTPVATRFQEAETKRIVRVCTLDEAGVAQRSLTVPVWRRLVDCRGTADEVTERMKKLGTSVDTERDTEAATDGHAQLRPLVGVVATVEANQLGLGDILREALQDRGTLVNLVQRLDGAEVTHEAEETIVLEDADLRELVLRRYREHHRVESVPDAAVRLIDQALASAGESSPGMRPSAEES